MKTNSGSTKEIKIHGQFLRTKKRDSGEKLVIIKRRDTQRKEDKVVQLGGVVREKHCQHRFENAKAV